ncbi:MAG TPA: hypothetical protein VN930_07295 [Xanthobacteraceae bacterium]|nr:hypothetical protein [Xanthobacteraceae bacterium]
MGNPNDPNQGQGQQNQNNPSQKPGQQQQRNPNQKPGQQQQGNPNQKPGQQGGHQDHDRNKSGQFQPNQGNKPSDLNR